MLLLKNCTILISADQINLFLQIKSPKDVTMVIKVVFIHKMAPNKLLKEQFPGTYKAPD